MTTWVAVAAVVSPRCPGAQRPALPCDAQRTLPSFSAKSWLCQLLSKRFVCLEETVAASKKMAKQSL